MRATGWDEFIPGSTPKALPLDAQDIHCENHLWNMPIDGLMQKARGFGRRLRDARMQRGLSVTDAALEFKTSRNIYRGWERSDGPVNITTHKLLRMADVFGVSVGWLLANEAVVELVTVSRSIRSQVTQEKVAEALASNRQVGRKISR